MSDDYDDIPEPIRRAFADQTYLPTPTVAQLLGMSVKTLRRHDKAGHIHGQQLGVGQIRLPRVYSLADAAAFIRLRREGKLCLTGESHRRSLSTHDHRTTNTTFRSRVIDFRAVSTRVGRGPNVTKRQRKRSCNAR
jgi:predicted site-specific integrase-resolvase